MKNWWEDDENVDHGERRSNKAGDMKVHHLSAYPNRAWDAMKVSGRPLPTRRNSRNSPGYREISISIEQNSVSHAHVMPGG